MRCLLAQSWEFSEKLGKKEAQYFFFYFFGSVLGWLTNDTLFPVAAASVYLRIRLFLGFSALANLQWVGFRFKGYIRKLTKPLEQQQKDDFKMMKHELVSINFFWKTKHFWKMSFSATNYEELHLLLSLEVLSKRVWYFWLVVRILRCLTLIQKRVFFT